MALNVLVVESAQVVGKALCDLIKREGHNSECVEKAEDAITRIGATNYDLILMAIGLNKGISGVEATRQICRLDTHPPVYLMSVDGYPVNHLIEQGATGFIDKFKLSEEVPELLREYQRKQENPSN